MPKCIQIYPCDIGSASRIHRTCRALVASQNFEDLGFLGISKEAVAKTLNTEGGFWYQHIEQISEEKSLLSKIKSTLKYSQQFYKIVAMERPDVVAIRTVAYLPLGVILKKRLGIKLVYDIHELETETAGAGKVKRTIYKLIERVGIASTDGVIVATEGIAGWYEAKYKIRKPVAVRAVPDKFQSRLGLFEKSIKQELGIPDEELLFAYVGLFEHSRFVIEIAEVFISLPKNRHIMFLGFGPLKGQLKQLEAKSRNIHIVPAVSPEEVISRLEGIDVGLIGSNGSSLSHQHSLPNKFFQSLFAGAPVIVPNLIEMKSIIEKFNCGWVYDGTMQHLNEVVASVTLEGISEKKPRVKEFVNSSTWEVESSKLIHEYRRVILSLP